MGDLQALEHPVGKKTKQRLWGSDAFRTFGYVEKTCKFEE